MDGPGGPAGNRPFRFGVVITPMQTGAALQRTARAAARYGYSILLAPDNMQLLSPMSSLAVAASAADLRVGTYVMSSPLRAPAVAAWEAHSLFVLTEGRFELGIGAGLPTIGPALAALGMEFETPAQRIQRIEQTIDRVTAISDGTRLHITMAGGGPRMRRLAGRLADSVILAAHPYIDAAGLGRLVSDFQRGAGDRAGQIELAMNLVMVGHGPIAPEVVKVLGLDAEKLIASNAVSVLRGTAGEMRDELQRRRDSLGVSYITVSEPMMEQFAPVAEALTGR
jgi:alkanesulfonate monooxygenase SsuD/methylene tetrahydromethanopterin reductase-like flavin-dependent oxidoreductase (luciferase family)